MDKDRRKIPTAKDKVYEKVFGFFYASTPPPPTRISRTRPLVTTDEALGDDRRGPR